MSGRPPMDSAWIEVTEREFIAAAGSSRTHPRAIIESGGGALYYLLREAMPPVAVSDLPAAENTGIEVIWREDGGTEQMVLWGGRWYSAHDEPWAPAELAAAIVRLRITAVPR